MEKRFFKVKQAFTLVELIVVITILAILGTIAFISLQGYSRDARDSTRTADLGNMKTSLELYSLKTGDYPKPDLFSTITYSGGTDKVWFQGVLGDQVTTNLKSLNEKPLDPLTNEPYIYSVTNNYNEYEILALYEGNIAYNLIINQINAATTSLAPKIVGNYNGVFVKTSHYIIPTPSIITSEPLTGGILILDPNSIQSQVITNGINIPKNSLTQTNTGQLNINLFVYTGSINKNSPDSEKINVIHQIQYTYSGSSIANQQNIAYVLHQTTNQQLISLSNLIVSGGLNSYSANNVNSVSYNNCGSGTLTGTLYSLVTYTYNSLNHGSTVVGTGNLSITNGNENYTGNINCNNGNVSISGENKVISCNSGYTDQGGSCVLDQCTGNIVSNGVSNATNQSILNSWTYNTTPGTCTFTCNANFTWNGSSCISNYTSPTNFAFFRVNSFNQNDYNANTSSKAVNHNGQSCLWKVYFNDTNSGGSSYDIVENGSTLMTVNPASDCSGGLCKKVINKCSLPYDGLSKTAYIVKAGITNTIGAPSSSFTNSCTSAGSGYDGWDNNCNRSIDERMSTSGGYCFTNVNKIPGSAYSCSSTCNGHSATFLYASWQAITGAMYADMNCNSVPLGNATIGVTNNSLSGIVPSSGNGYPNIAGNTSLPTVATPCQRTQINLPSAGTTKINSVSSFNQGQCIYIINTYTYY